MSSNLVNRRQRIIPETTYSTANQWFARGQEEAEPTTTEITEEHNVTPRVAQRFSTAPQPTSIRFFDASSISTIKPTASNVKAIEEAPSPQVDLSEIPRAKAILLHKVQPADTFAGLSLKYGIEVGVLRRVNKLWSGDPLQLRSELKIPILHCTITDAEIKTLDARIVSKEDIESSESRKNVESRLEVDSYSPRSSSSWSSSSSVLEDSREILEPLTNLVSRAVDSISRPLKQSHAWSVMNNATLRRSKRDPFVPSHEEGLWIQMTPTDKLHSS